ncbi:hypothetical protein RHGRI_014573 [Rhododendron griersonianum]|uniref:DUF4283 domain-containing protein n=1 Tax=Rhododendron griersonianum TaxID=479676 RepID=A0AAV6KA72_9ERIC|nr:hypothetical protein RHGRI_014573 [Rhododendron griersonianum]
MFPASLLSIESVSSTFVRIGEGYFLHQFMMIMLKNSRGYRDYHWHDDGFLLDDPMVSVCKLFDPSHHKQPYSVDQAIGQDIRRRNNVPKIHTSNHGWLLFTNLYLHPSEILHRFSFTVALMACLSENSSNTGDPDFIDQRGWLFPTDPVISSQLRNLWEQTLLGCFIYDHLFSDATIQNVVNFFWHTKGSVLVEKRSGVFCFHFEDQYDFDYILAEQPWNVHGAVLVLQPWAPNTILPQLQFPAMDVWVQANNIPIESYYSDLANLLGLAAGHLLQVDWSDDRTQSLDYFKFKVRIHTDEPLIPGAFIELMEGDYHWIPFRYERIFRVCYKCGRIGHSNHARKSSLVEALDNLHQCYNVSPFSSSFPLILENNKPMFSPSLRALRNTRCNRATRIWVLYEDEVQAMDMDQNLIFYVDISDCHSSDEVFHTPAGGPLHQALLTHSALSFFRPPSPSLINSPTALANPNFNPTIHSTPTPTPPLSLEKSTPINHQLNIGQASTLHATTSNIPLAVSAPTPTPLAFTPLVTHDFTPAFQHNFSQPLPSNNENHTDPTPTSIPLKVSEVFICSAPDFIGDDSLVNFVPQALNPEKVGTDLSLSHAIKQQPSLSKKRSSSSSFDAESSEGGPSPLPGGPRPKAGPACRPRDTSWTTQAFEGQPYHLRRGVCSGIPLLSLLR